MGRRVYRGGESSLGYLFGGSGEAPTSPSIAQNPGSPAKNESSTTSQPNDGITAAGVQSSPNNYVRVEGQNRGNFLTDRPSTKVHSAPGGRSSLGYLFGGDRN